MAREGQGFGATPAGSRTCLPVSIRIRPGCSGDQPADSASRNFMPSWLGEICFGFGPDPAVGEARDLRIRGAPRRWIHLFLKAPAHIAPVAQVFGDAPQQFQRRRRSSAAISAAAASRNASAGARDSSGKHHQELPASAGSKQNFRQAEFGQQRARKHFTQQADPVGAAE